MEWVQPLEQLRAVCGPMGSCPWLEMAGVQRCSSCGQRSSRQGGIDGFIVPLVFPEPQDISSADSAQGWMSLTYLNFTHAHPFQSCFTFSHWLEIGCKAHNPSSGHYQKGNALFKANLAFLKLSWQKINHRKFQKEKKFYKGDHRLESISVMSLILSPLNLLHREPTLPFHRWPALVWSPEKKLHPLSCLWSFLRWKAGGKTD